VALEAGNSPQIIFQHYRELVRPKDAKGWFSITPGEDGVVGSVIVGDRAHGNPIGGVQVCVLL